MTKMSILTAACITALQGSLACGNNDENAAMAGAGGNSGSTGASASGGMTLGGVTSRTDAATGDSRVLELAANLTDSEMLNVVQVASAGEVRSANLAENKAITPSVRAFASGMAKDDAIVEYTAALTAASMGLAPSPNEVASLVTVVNDAVFQAMTARPSGIEFDRTYMGEQIGARNGTIDLVKQMLPNADSMQLRSVLANVLTGEQRHLDEANLILLSLQ